LALRLGFSAVPPRSRFGLAAGLFGGAGPIPAAPAGAGIGSARRPGSAGSGGPGSAR
jgi:hypothetical protein